MLKKRTSTMARLLGVALLASLSGCATAYHDYPGCCIPYRYCPCPPLPYITYEGCHCPTPGASMCCQHHPNSSDDAVESDSSLRDSTSSASSAFVGGHGILDHSEKAGPVDGLF